MDIAREAHYDLFILHADADRAWVDGYLKHAIGVDTTRLVTRQDFTLGASIPAEFDRVVRSSRYTALVLSPAFLADRWGEFGEQLVSFTSVEEDRNRIIMMTLHPCQTPLHVRFRVGLDCTDWTSWDEQASKVRALLERPDPPPEVIPCPYPGMVPFRLQDAPLFHGRDQELDDLLRLFRHNSFLLVVGPSGSGKSSMIVAGLLPRLQKPRNFEQGYWRVRTFRPGSDPLARLTEQLGGDAHRPADAVKSILEAEPRAQRLLLFVDQFEELFTQVKDRAVQEDFISALKNLREDPRCLIIAGMRVDFYPDLMSSALWPVPRSQIVDVAPLRGEALRQAIVRPAEAIGVYLEEALVDSLIADAANEPGSLPMLQEALVMLWAKRERRLLTRAAYQAMGRDGRSGLAVAMATKADASLAAMPLEEQRLARRVFLRLVEFGQGRPDTRRQLAEDELRAAVDPPGMFGRVLAKLIDNRLLTPASEDQGPRRVDIAHEMLIVGWPTSREWVQVRRQAELTRRALETKAREWIRLGKGPGGLLDAAELPEAQQWLASAEAAELGYSSAFMEHVKASADHLEQERRRARRRVRVAIGGLLTGLVIMTWLTYWGWVKAGQASEGENAARLAGHQAKLSEQQSRATSIQIALERGDWQRALEQISIALREGEGNPVALRLDKIWALVAMQNVQGATDEIDVITRLPDLQGYEANVLLWQGELEWNRTRSLEKTMGLIRSALERGFRAEPDRDKKYAEADREYAEGLVSETVDLAVKHFRKAIEKVKSHHRANRMLGLLLILTGSIPEARALIAVAELLFPDDPTFKILEAWAAAAEDQLPSARDRLGKLASSPADHTRPILSEEQVKWARDIAELVDQVRKLELNPIHPNIWPILHVLTKINEVLSQDHGPSQKPGSERATLFFPFPPVLMRSTEDLQKLPFALFRGDQQKAKVLLERIIAIHPDAILLLLLGLVEFEDERLPELERYTRAEKAFLKAAEARSLVPVRHTAEFCVMACRWMSADVPPKNQAMLDQAAELMRRFVDSGTVRPYMAELVTHIACLVGDWDRARWLLHQWPNEPVSQRYRPRILYETHSYDLAVQAEDKVLERDPTNTHALEMRSSIMDKFHKQLEQLKAPKAAVPKSP